MRDQTIPQLIRTLRERRRLAGYQLAKMAGISPSYLSLIESGQKLPSIKVAERLAKVLGADPEVFRAWVETADEPDLAARQSRLDKLRAVQSPLPRAMLHRRGRSRVRGLVDGLAWGGGKGERARAGSTPEETAEADETAGLAEAADPASLKLDEAAASLQSMALEPEHPTAQGSVMDYMPVGLEQTVHVPLLKEGTDPDRLRGSEHLIDETIAVDRGLLEDDQDPRELFAYRVTSRSIERVHNLVLPGDILVFATNPEGVDPTAVYAVRAGRGILLSRIVYSDPVLLLTPADHNQSPMQVDVGNEEGLRRALAGVVVTGIRTWRKPRRAESSAQTSLGRSGRIESGSIVRDCEWRDGYGWRPVQRAEDMDYLDSHPGATVKFRLMRDGRVKRVLEMDADQWRGALGDYYEGPTWRPNGYIVAITKRVRGEYTEKFQDRWAEYVRKPKRSER